MNGHTGRRRRRGLGAFTLVELLVVVAIIGVLVALLLPAIQAAREASRRTQCANNLKQIDLGLQHYHDTYLKFPAGYYQGPSPNSQNESTWVTHLLPYIEQKALFDTIPTWATCFGCQPNNVVTVVSTSFKTFQCPSNKETPPAFTYYAKGSYVGNNGIGPMATESWNTVTRGPYGMFRQNTSLRMSDILDGTANTVFVSELLNVEGDFRGVMHYPEGPLYHHNYPPNSPVPDQHRSGMCVSTVTAPCTGTYSAWNNRAMVLSARSNHPGGVQIGLVDGSVRFASNTIALTVWQNLGIPDDRNPIANY